MLKGEKQDKRGVFSEEASFYNAHTMGIWVAKFHRIIPLGSATVKEERWPERFR